MRWCRRSQMNWRRRWFVHNFAHLLRIRQPSLNDYRWWLGRQWSKVFAYNLLRRAINSARYCVYFGGQLWWWRWRLLAYYLWWRMRWMWWLMTHVQRRLSGRLHIGHLPHYNVAVRWQWHRLYVTHRNVLIVGDWRWLLAYHYRTWVLIERNVRERVLSLKS